MAAKDLPVLNGIDVLWTTMRHDITDPATGVDRPELVVRVMVLSAIRQFSSLHSGRKPALLFIPRCVESALQVDRGRNMGVSEKEHGRIRNEASIFGIKPVWDATEFKVE